MTGLSSAQSIPEFPVEPLPDGWATYAVTFSHRNGAKETRYEIIDLKTRSRYLHEPMKDIAMKCLQLVVGIPLYLSFYVGWHLIRTPITALATVLVSLREALKHQTKIHTIQFFKDLLSTAPKQILLGLWTVVRAPFYAIAMELAAIYGTFSPLEGRKLVGIIERGWHGVPRTHDLRYINPQPSPMYMLSALGDKNYNHTFYLAYCMQPFGKLADTHIVFAKEAHPTLELLLQRA